MFVQFFNLKPHHETINVTNAGQIDISVLREAFHVSQYAHRYRRLKSELNRKKRSFKAGNQSGSLGKSLSELPSPDNFVASLNPRTRRIITIIESRWGKLQSAASTRVPSISGYGPSMGRPLLVVKLETVHKSCS